LGGEIGKGIEIIFADDKEAYFRKFNDVLRRTDILWTKPSELSFYAGLGMPINHGASYRVLRKNSTEHGSLATGAGVEQEDPKYAGEWIFDWLEEGIFMESAIKGYFEAEKHGLSTLKK